MFENFNLITGVNALCQCSVLIAIVVRILSRFVGPHGQQIKRKEHINFVVVTYGLVKVAACISTMSLYVGITWFCYGVSNSLSNHFNLHPKQGRSE